MSTDKEFAPKAAEVVGLYLNPPVNAVVLSVDEKPSITTVRDLIAAEFITCLESADKRPSEDLSI